MVSAEITLAYLLDPANSLQVENLFTSDIFKETCQRVYEWNQKGYISQDAVTNDTALSAQVKSGSYMSMMAQAKRATAHRFLGNVVVRWLYFR